MFLQKNRTVLLGVFLAVAIFSCSKWDLDRTSFTKVITIGAIEVGSNSAFLIGDIEDIRMTSIVESGFILSFSAGDDENLRLDQTEVDQFLSPGLDTIFEDRAFAARATGLSGSTEYFFRAYAKIAGEERVVYGQIDRFTTSDFVISIKSVNRASGDCNTTAVVEVFLEGYMEGGGTEVGLVWADAIYLGPSSGLQGNTITENTPGGLPGILIFMLSVVCNKSYTLSAYAAQPSGDRLYTELRSFTMMEGGEWKVKTNFPGEERMFPVSFAIDNNIYLGAGRLFFSNFPESGQLFDIWSYSADSDSWSAIGELEKGFSSGVGVSANGVGYFGSGQWSSEQCLQFNGGTCGFLMNCSSTCHCMSEEFYEFEPDSRTWNKIALPNPIFGRIRRHSGIAVNIADKIYYGFGNLTYSCGSVISWAGNYPVGAVLTGQFLTYNDMWQLDPLTEEWNEMQPLSKEARIRPVGFSILKKGYFGLGHYYRLGETPEGPSNPDPLTGPLNDFYEFDPSLPHGSQWKILEPFPGEFEYVKGFALGETGFVLAGKEFNFNSTVELWKFDRKAGQLGSWSKISNNIIPGITGIISAALSIGNKAFIYFAGPEENFWMYIPELE